MGILENDHLGLGGLPWGLVFWRTLCLVSRGVSLLHCEQQSCGRRRSVRSLLPGPLRRCLRGARGGVANLLDVTAVFKVPGF